MFQKAGVFIITDSHYLREFLKSILRTRYRVVAERRIEDALEYISDCSINVVLLDLNISDMDAMDALREIKERYPEIEVILLTAHVSMNKIREAISIGAYGFLMKPFGVDQLLYKVDEAVNKISGGIKDDRYKKICKRGSS